MPITQELKDKLDTYQQSYSPTEILDSLKNSGKYPDISGKIDSYRQSYSDDEILNSIKSQPVQNLQNDEGFFTRVNKAMQERGVKIYDVTREGSTPEKIFRVAGQEVAALTDVGLEGIKSLYKTLMPDKYQESISQGVKDIAASPAGQSTLNSIQGAAQGWESFRKENPNIAMDAEAAMNIGGPLSAAKVLKAFTTLTKPGVQAAAQVGGAVAKEPLQFLGDISAMAKGNQNIDNSINKVVREKFPQAIRPSVVGKYNKNQLEDYYSNASQAVKSILENKNNLSLTDSSGNIIEGKTPKNLSQFSEAIQQTKKIIFKEYDDLTKQATGQGVKIDLTPIVNELDNIASKKTIQDLSPESASYAKKMAETFSKRDFYSANEAQDAIQTLNQSLKAFYKNPTYDNASKAGIDAMIANNLRKLLDDTILVSTGKEYQIIKNKYSALKSIEKDVLNRTIVNERKNPIGLLDFSNMYTAAHYASGLVKLDPGALASATAVGITKKIMSHLNDPNIMVKNLFNEVEKLKDSAERITNPKSETMKFITQKSPKR